jgi:hypothetical protein
MSQARFQKRMREKAKQEKQAAKRERKAAERAEAAEATDDVLTADVPPEATVLEQLAALHAQFADDAIGFDEFEERKQELLAQLDV